MNEKNILFRTIKNRLFEAVILIFAVSLIVPLFLIIFMIIQKGIAVINWEFLFSERTLLGVKGGGILKDVIGTFMLVGIAVLLSVPLGILTGIFLAEKRKNKLVFFVQWCIDILQGVPSIVLGLIGYLWIVIPMRTFSAFSGGFALSFMMLPVVIKSTEETLKLIPHSLKEASIALGVPYYKTVLKILLPSSLSGIVTGVILGIARIAGETAPLLFTAFGNPSLNGDIFKPVGSLPHLIFNYATSAYPESHSIAWGASFVLVSLILILNIITKLVVQKWKIRY